MPGPLPRYESDEPKGAYKRGPGPGPLPNSMKSKTPDPCQSNETLDSRSAALGDRKEERRRLVRAH
jgi:hypothetical protein